jgi:hypothetical protein
MLLMFDSSVHSKLKAYPDINAGFKLKLELYIVNTSVYSSTRCVRPLGPNMDHTIYQECITQEHSDKVCGLAPGKCLEVGSEPVCYSRKIILQQQEM